MIGWDKLENLVDDFNFKTRFVNLLSILVDQEGNIVVKDSQPIKDKINILEKDNFVKSFIKNDEAKFSLQTNFNHDLTYVRGSTINLKNNNKFYLFSYLPYSQFKSEFNLLMIGVKQLYLIIFIGTVVVFVLGWLISIFTARDLIKKIR